MTPIAAEVAVPILGYGLALTVNRVTGRRAPLAA